MNTNRTSSHTGGKAPALTDYLTIDDFVAAVAFVVIVGWLFVGGTP